MKKNIIKIAAYIAIALPLGGVGGGLFTSCSDVELEEATYSEAVRNLVAEYTQGQRQVTLRWDNPTMAGQSGIQIIKDNLDVTNINEVVSSYFI